MRRLLLLGAVVAAVVASIAVPMVLHEPRAIKRDHGVGTEGLAAGEIRFASDGLDLAGQIFVPPEKPLAAVAIIHGSGTSRRDNGWYAALTGQLVARGFVVLLPDKRGSEASGGDWRTASMEDLAGDALASVGVLRARFQGLPTGLVGVSQGGWVAAVAAERDPTLDFVANLSGSSVRPAEQLVLEERNTMHEDMGMPLWAARALAPLTAWNIRRNVQPEFWDRLDTFYANDHWAHVTVPAFIAYGALDEFDNVPVAESVARLEALGNPALEVHVYGNVGHGFFDYATGAFHPQFIPDLVSFVETAVGR